MFNSISLTLYTQEDCNYCHELKKKLAAWDFKWHEINISYDLFNNCAPKLSPDWAHSEDLFQA